MIETLKSKFNDLDPTIRYRVTLGVVGIVVLGILYVFVSNEPPQRTSGKDSGPRSVQLTSGELDGLDMDTLATRVDELERTTRSIDERLGEIAETAETAEENAEQEREDGDSRAEVPPEVVERLNRLEEATRAIGEMAAQSPQPVTPKPSDQGTGEQTTSGAPDRDGIDENSVWQDTPAPVRSSAPDEEADGQQGAAEPAAAGALRSFGGRSESDEDTEDEEKFVHLPAGSILSGELLSGLDAPTSQATRSDPFPALIRVNKNAILPNRYQADVRECFIIAEAYGDLSSERAYMRGNTISCVRHDDDVIETRLALYAVGEDGKAGMRGPLVSKQGQMLTRAMMAGFLEGISGAFNTQQVPSLNLDGGEAQWQDMMSEEALQSGVATGTSRALDRLSQFYIEMAEGMFPVIEIGAGRNVDLIVTKGQTLE